MKLKIILASAILAIASPLIMSASQPALVQKADSAYTAENYMEAASLYQTAIDSLGTSSDLYYNLGNALYRLGKSGQAVVAYERALKLDPTNTDARTNLEFVNSRLIDRPAERGTLVGNMIDTASLALHSNAWAWTAFGCFLVFLGAVALYMFCPSVIWRKVGFFGGFGVLILAVISGFLSARNAAICQSTDKAVIIVPSTILSTSPRAPRDRAEEAMLLHEGTKMRILDSVSTRTDSVKAVWLDVEIDNQHRAWIDRNAVEII